MTMQRRGFLGAMLAACAAPAFVPSGSLMRIVAPPQGLWLPPAGQSLADMIFRINPEPTPFVKFDQSRHQLGNGLNLWIAEPVYFVGKQ